MKKIIIVGAGIIGVTTAFELVKRNYEVTIIDSEEKGRATLAAAGIICPWISQRRSKNWYELASKGATFLDKFILELQKDGETDTGYKKVGALRIDTDMEKLQKLQKIALDRRATNEQIGEINVLTKEETAKKFPWLADEYYALYVEGAARVDGEAFRGALLKQALSLGATFISGKASLELNGQDIVGVNVTNTEGVLENHHADYVILTNGVWMPETLAPLGIHLPMKIQKGEIVHIQTEASEADVNPVIMAPFDQYILSFSNGRFVIGSTRENNPTHLQCTIGGLHSILHRALEVAPAFATSTLIETRVGLRPFTKNQFPVFGKVPSVKNLFLANGLGSSGLSTGPFIGLQLAKMIAHEQPDLDWDRYHIEQAIG